MTGEHPSHHIVTICFSPGKIDSLHNFRIYSTVLLVMGFPGGSVVKNSPADAGDAGDVRSMLGSGRSPVEGNGNPLLYSCLANCMDRGTWRVQSMGSQRVRLTEHTCTHY